ncbi:Transcriptional regulatory protein sin3 [Taxawa tesnikishii (nom. ined.)]|nr:Transcriptional regulatory protein sin3 [Dothideales sp. JES 119]
MAFRTIHAHSGSPLPPPDPTFDDALEYVDQIRIQTAAKPWIYNEFLNILSEFRMGLIDTIGVLNRVSTLFANHPDLFDGLNDFLPPRYKFWGSSGWKTKSSDMARN